MSSPPAECHRTDAASIARSKIWYKDGSVILQAENTQFRVHWGVLSQHSSFFRDLEDLPQPTDEPAVDGCPIVELQDSAVDVEHLLTALYDPTFLILSQTALPLTVVGDLIRLGRKYDFKNILDSAVARLMFENPATLAGYDALIVDGKYQPTRIMSSPGQLDKFDLLALVRENNIGLALPVAYYRACALQSRVQLLHAAQKDETFPTPSLDDLLRCLLGRQRLATKLFQPGYTLGWLREWPYPHADCERPKECKAARKKKFYHFMDHNIIRPFHNVQAERWRKVLCNACYKHVVESITTGRKKMWEELPSFFDLPPWSELKNDL